MNRRIILSPDAWADFESAARWYRRKERNLSGRFKAEVQTTLLRIARHPYVSLGVANGVRRVLLNRFPYQIHFRFNVDTVLVLAITHQRRSDAIWQDAKIN